MGDSSRKREFDSYEISIRGRASSLDPLTVFLWFMVQLRKSINFRVESYSTFKTEGKRELYIPKDPDTED